VEYSVGRINSALNLLVMAGVAVAVFVLAMTPKPLPSDAQFAARIESADTVLVKFGADWCGPCRQMEKELDDLAEVAPDVSVMRLDVGRDQELAAYYGVSSIPHVILFKHGKQVGQLKGYRTREQLAEWIGAAK
jgi:thioredoxin